MLLMEGERIALGILERGGMQPIGLGVVGQRLTRFEEQGEKVCTAGMVGGAALCGRLLEGEQLIETCPSVLELPLLEQGVDVPGEPIVPPSLSKKLAQGRISAAPGFRLAENVLRLEDCGVQQGAEPLQRPGINPWTDDGNVITVC